MLSVHSAMGHDLHPMDRGNCELTLGEPPMAHLFIVCKHLKKDLVIGLDMQQKYCIGSDWTTDSQMYLHQRQHVLINFSDIDSTNLKLRLVNQIELPACTIVTISTKHQSWLRTPVS